MASAGTLYPDSGTSRRDGRHFTKYGDLRKSRKSASKPTSYAKKFDAGIARENARFFVVLEQQIPHSGVETTPLLRFCIIFSRSGSLAMTDDRPDLWVK